MLEDKEKAGNREGALQSSVVSKGISEAKEKSGVYFLQTKFWAMFKAAHGWSAVEVEGVYVLIRTFKKGPIHFSIAYVPMMSVAHSTDSAVLPPKEEADYLVEKVHSMISLLPRDTLFVRSDIALDFSTCEERDGFLCRLPKTVRKSKVDVQPPDTVILDLIDDKGAARKESEILKAMKSKWRYNIRLAEKHGVIVTSYRAGDKEIDSAIDVFYALYEETSARDKIAIHPKSYYASLLKMEEGDEVKVTLYIARHEGDNLAAIITVFTKSTATYLYGASGKVKRNLMGAYLLQWTAIKDALIAGDIAYDFYGIPPTADKNHPMAGLYLFKKGFGGREVHRAGSIDVSLSPMYTLYTIAERARAFFYKKVRKIKRH